MFEEKNNYAMIDLHGLSVDSAKRVVNHWLSVSSRLNYNCIRFVTGRGNHVNAQGNRGTLYKTFTAWIEQSAYKDRIEYCNQYNGYYEIQFKSTAPQKSVSDFFEKPVKTFLNTHLNEIKEYAEAGEPYFQMLYASMLEKGENITQNYKEAAKYYELASNQQYPPAMHELARCYLHGRGVKQNDGKAFHWLKKADELDLPDSTVSLGDCYWNGYGVKRDPTIAISYYAKAAAKHQEPTAMRKLASAYKQGIGVKKDEYKAFSWYKKSADLNDVLSQYNTAVMYENGQGTEQDEQNAYKYFELAAEGGDLDAQFHLGELYLFKENYEKANYWLEKAAKNGSLPANHLLSRIADKNSRRQYLEKSAKLGNFMDKLLLNHDKYKNLSNNEFNIIFDKAIEESYDLPILDIIHQDNHTKFLLIDHMLLQNIKKYRKKALKTIEIMAEENCIFSLRRLAKFYCTGCKEFNISKNLEKAIGYTRQASNLNDPKSQVLLGYFYEKGIGVEPSIPTAHSYYDAAIKQNYPGAYYQMGIMLLENIKGLEDILLAQKLFQSAIAYESDKKKLKNLSSGIIDKYSPITASAEKTLVKLPLLIQSIRETPQFAPIINNDFYFNDTIEEINFPRSEADLEQASTTNNNNNNNNVVNDVDNDESNNQNYYCLIL